MGVIVTHVVSWMLKMTSKIILKYFDEYEHISC